MGKRTANLIRLLVTLSAGVTLLVAFGPSVANAGAATTAGVGPVDSGAQSAAPTTPTTQPVGSQTPAWSFVPLSATANALSRTAIHLIAAPGQTVSDTAVLTNYSNTVLNFNVYGSDAYNTVKLGAFTLQPPDAPKHEVGKWITEPVNQINLPGKTSDEFRFTVTVPLDASPGDHAGGVVALNLAPPTGAGSGTNVAIQRGEGIAVYVRVPGKLHPGVAAADIGVTKSTPILGFGSSSAQAHYEVVNTGNEVLNGKADLEAVDVFGSVVKKYKPVAIDALIPGQKMAIVEPRWTGLPFIGPVHLKVAMTTTSTTSNGESVFWVIPWLLILIIVLVIVALIAYWIHRRRRKRAILPPPAVSGAGAADAVSSQPAAGEAAPVG